MSFVNSFLGDGASKVPQEDVHWVAAGLTLFAFAAPSAVQSAPFFIGGTGLIGGILICLVNTLGACAGSWMLLQVKLRFPAAHNFGDLGFQVLGPVGRICGNFLQLGNFVLFLPCALLFTGQALSGIGDGISAFTQDNGQPCWDYYIFSIAAICFLTTQARTLSNTAVFSAISVLSVFAMAISQIYAAFKFDAAEKEPAQWFGNDGENSLVLFTRAASICVFGYVPSFLTAELASCMREPKAMTKSIVLSGVMNVVMMLGVGLVVVSRWGYNVGYVAPLTGAIPGTVKTTAWASGTVLTNILQVFALTGNFVSYMLDSVPLGRFCQLKWAPRFQDTWSFPDMLRYVKYTLPVFFLGLGMAIFFPSLDFLIGVVTFCTTPWVTMVYPSILYWKTFGEDSSTLARSAIIATFVIGMGGFAISFFASIGQLMIEGTADWQIGCQGWMILSPAPHVSTM